MEKGINLLIKDTRDEITKVVNKSLQTLPISIIDMILDNVMLELKNGLTAQLEQEQRDYNEGLKVESEQVEYVEPVEQEPIEQVSVEVVE